MPDSTLVKKPKKTNYSYAVGRRKTATARIRLFNSPTVPGFEKDSQIVVNDQPVEAYFPGELAKRAYTEPFILTETLKKMSVSARILGSGKSGQLDALVHGIARALAALDVEKFRGPLKSAGLLTRDPRAKERRKVGKGGSARRSKQSPKR
ncbi:MAG: 30S ribosomal protein S9 [bacterium]